MTRRGTTNDRRRARECDTTLRRCPFAVLLLFGMVAAGAASPISGQQWQLDATAAGVGPDTAQLFGSASIAPALEWRQRTLFGRLTAGWSGFEGSTWAVHGRSELALVAEPFGLLHPVRFEVVGYGQGTYHSSDFRTFTSRAEGRVHISGARTGVWLAPWAAPDGHRLTATCSR